MKRITATLLLCLLAQPYARGAEPDSDSAVPPQRVDGNTLSEAVRVEAARLALAAPTRGVRGQSGQGVKKVDERNWCRRHLVGCGALVGLAAGFVAGWAWAPEDFGAMPSALVLGAYGTGIGAATGGIIWAYTDRQP